MGCEAVTRGGAPCRAAALAGGTRCASHAGRCGARPGNRNALRHGLYSRLLSPEVQLDLLAARATEGLAEEIAVTRLLIRRAVRDQDSPATITRLVEALCRQLRVQRQLGDTESAASIAAIERLAEAALQDLERAAGWAGAAEAASGVAPEAVVGVVRGEAS
jgi:hypothetical protein